MTHLKYSVAVVTIVLSLVSIPTSNLEAASPQDVVKAIVNREYASLYSLYTNLHAHPEVSFQEKNTAARVATELARAGFTVTENVGGYGVVAVLKNGDGPTLLVRSDLDALPVKELTGLPYASVERTRDEKGNDVDVMHACGHDIHMTCLVGTARTVAAVKDQWRGTLVMIGQPAEERGGGARAMLKDGLFTRFPKPDSCIALHVAADMPAGTVGHVEGPALANVDSVDITVRGVGGHGAWPHTTKDPIVLASQIVLALQTIVSREIPPGEPAVVTVGSIKGGEKHNIIPEEVHLQITLRSYTDAVREQTVAAVKRIVNGLAQAAGIPENRLPIIKIKDEFTPALHNDPALMLRMAGVFEQWLSSPNVIPRKPVMGGEDFSEYGRTADRIPVAMFWLGAASPETLRETLRVGKIPPSLHSAFFRPEPEPTIKTGVTAMSAAVLDLLGNGQGKK